ncbi:7-keto-8-aminopelargonate synthetase or related enzyme [Chromobacterium violaceum]|uniref:5-aminolevulinate synthase n=1 Tax=Chromobacterium violaceum TaxID=536 RepID=UPI0009B8BF54|nr:5-aminolevulinate synthase [Chromobacterium violaceum]
MSTDNATIELNLDRELRVLFEDRLTQLKSEGLYRSFMPCEHDARHPGTTRYRQRQVEVWCSNDYLGLSQDPQVIERLRESAALHGSGTGGSRNIAGTSISHVELERQLAQWHGKEQALVFNGGYTANFEFLSTLIAAVPDMAIFSDSLNHRSLIEGIRRHPCQKFIFPHNDVETLEKQLASVPLSQPKLIVFESIYSMDGDIAPIQVILDLADRYQAWTFLDETHAIGLYGASGAGLCEEIEETRATFIQGVFGKAMGTLGGYIAGPASVVDFVRSSAPGFIFTTALPQALLDATLCSFERVREDRQLVQDLHSNVIFFRAQLDAAGIPYLPAQSHLVLVPVAGAERIKTVARRLLEEFDIYVQPINYPSVPRGGERFRLTVGPRRSHEEIQRFVAALKHCLA